MNTNNQNVNNNNDNKIDLLNNKDNNSNSSQELKSFSSKSNGLNKNLFDEHINNGLKKSNKVKINNEIDILKYKRNEKMVEYTPTKENKKTSKNKPKKKKEKGILKNKIGRSKTLLIQPSRNQNGIIEFNIKKSVDEIDGNGNDIDKSIDNSFDIIHTRRASDIFLNNNAFNKKVIKKLIENRKKNKEKKKKDKDLNNKKNIKEKNELFNVDYFDYEVDYSAKKNKYQEKNMNENQKKIKKSKKVKKSEKDKSNRSFDDVIYF